MPPRTRNQTGARANKKLKQQLQEEKHEGEPCASEVAKTYCNLHLNSPWVPLFPAARLKRMMQSDPDTGQIAGDGIETMNQLVELFIKDLGHRLADASEGQKNMSIHALQEVVSSEPLFDFLIPVLEKSKEGTAHEHNVNRTKVARKRKRNATANTESIEIDSKEASSGPSKVQAKIFSLGLTYSTEKLEHQTNAESEVSDFDD